MEYPDKIKDLELWYRKKRDHYEDLAKSASSTIANILSVKDIKYHSITYRTKDIDSLIAKAKNKNYKNPIVEIQDYAGIRIVAFIKSDVDKICRIIENEFQIDKENSVDKGSALGEDKVGYRSVHYIAGYSDDRMRLIDFSRYRNMSFEIQVRTILEHAWADISHDRTYKFSTDLTNENDIKRRFALAAASLELVDIEFDRLANEILNFSAKIQNATTFSELDILIDGTSLATYIENKFESKIDGDYFEYSLNDSESAIIQELKNLNITKLNELDKLIDSIPEETISLILEKVENLVWLIRYILLAVHKDKYFSEGSVGQWQYYADFEVPFFDELGIDIGKAEYGLEIIEFYGTDE